MVVCFGGGEKPWTVGHVVVEGDGGLAVALEFHAVACVLPGHVAHHLQSLLPVVTQLSFDAFDMHRRHIDILHHAFLLRHLWLDVIVYMAQESVHLIGEGVAMASQCAE